jgi:hypothetical protein
MELCLDLLTSSVVMGMSATKDRGRELLTDVNIHVQ